MLTDEALSLYDGHSETALVAVNDGAENGSTKCRYLLMLVYIKFIYNPHSITTPFSHRHQLMAEGYMQS